MNYSEMSDAEINICVAQLIFPNKKVIGSASRPPKAHIVGGGLRAGSWVDYCNSWDDAGPIIQKNNISILIDDTTQKWSSASVQDFTNVSAYKFGNCHENPLRAAMIVFLMMQEKSNE